VDGRAFPRVLSVALASAVVLSGCYEGIDPSEWYGADDNDSWDSFSNETGDEGQDSSGGDGDGDGDPGDGDGDSSTGDGDGDSSTGDGDGDPNTGDGDGDPTTGDGDGDGEPEPEPEPDPSVPDNSYCNPVANWNSAWVDLELQVLTLVNQARAQGGNCGSQGNFGPSGPLTLVPALTCAARVHSKDMADNNFFSHTNLQGQGPGYRIAQAGYNGSGWGENIAAGYSTPQQVIDGWLSSDGHCANMLNPGFKDIGIGYAYGPNSQYGHYWTQVFGGG
jgi:uncharacterized protein YkwD